ncbi:TetR/AcrR family transcriptional regulator [Tabrizicola sp.]|uniref:TetR/AcrR family transcriptional regulator n=1 Tax=Tabrizicola sp. TaxID=2005166 RepID=UPI002733E2C0|nr:TetR/AcrR family transcriptional regulator [Tabrizicola sp.]MDP3195270.1 helix-turn-helix domain-containing protein [Tabrizicola sp.]
MTAQSKLEAPVEPGLRDRKKARRRDEIIAAAKDLFARQGIDATTMADIAAAAGISSPTVFNYFGSKDGILIAMITEGTMEARESDRALHWREGDDLAGLITGLFVRVSSRTLEIAGKRVWRYAEAAAIRHPDAELSRQYAAVSAALIDVVADFFADISLTTRAGTDCAPDWLAAVFHDLWMPCFIRLITDEKETLAEHEATLHARFGPLVKMLFTDDCASHPRRKMRG